jgi:hypothetical protein
MLYDAMQLITLRILYLNSRNILLRSEAGPRLCWDAVGPLQ